MKISILDQAPVAAGRSAGDALREAALLAQAGDKLGYERYWLAEHHDLNGLACSAPEAMLGYLGAQTSRIRLGAGAILLPYYRPYKVAETFNLLAALLPGRIDLGIARSPGGPAESSMALSDNFLERVWKLPEAFEELLHFLDGDFPADHAYAKTVAAPTPDIPPEPWVLGTSVKSAKLAAEQGTAYAFGHFMQADNAAEARETYFRHFRPRPERRREEPYFLLAVSAFCADTADRALELSLSAYAWRLQAAAGERGEGLPSVAEARRALDGQDEREIHARIRQSSAVGDPEEVKAKLLGLQTDYGADELMLISYAHDFADRVRSYELIAGVLNGASGRS
ncbi:LLM class flavin-dependent oxidoreductase [Cohnella nanjingensis]|uniref:LLM class flavin-dependent oxidoreductase n=1 Tax=Cohnella nanjingensis TaxID=1387779 RepID=A0A7X0RWK0_9BACL|nr:LLM class flavin-dependent oxidoreductase [Cohnella nanjingensis]MBB6674946.1 LLM class flavin-dependent oxidoreductase [Cohnella nanjingensis]